MKKLLLIVIVLSFFASCGPHRMSCGARGICDTSEKQILHQPKISHNSQIEKIQSKIPSQFYYRGGILI
ncbi:MAG: hypothetical protein K2X95_03500 [Flavobacteriaceae bacterium]|nr:hypothetical protein [Flavobacteriaceae bacterium]